MRVLVCVKRVPFTGGKMVVMSGNLGVSPALSRGGPKGIRSTAVCIAPSANSAGFAALLTFPGMGFCEKPLLATHGGKLDKGVAGASPATSAMQVTRCS